VQENLREDSEEDIHLRERLLGLLLRTVLPGRLRLIINLHFLTGLAAQSHIWPADGLEDLLGKRSRGRGRRVRLRDDLGEDVGRKPFPDGRDGPQRAEGESCIEKRNGAVEVGKIALDICGYAASHLDQLFLIPP
jgi:hypothetical protein